MPTFNMCLTKNKFISVTFVLFFAGILFSDCRKSIDSNSELIGKWHSPQYDQDFKNINIDESGNGGFGTGVNSWDVPSTKRVRANGNSFKIGITKFEILVHPIPFDSATDWTGAVMDAFAPGNMPTEKMEIKQGKESRWYYKRRQ
jgi:hypothetical protein